MVFILDEEMEKLEAKTEQKAIQRELLSWGRVGSSLVLESREQTRRVHEVIRSNEWKVIY